MAETGKAMATVFSRILDQSLPADMLDEDQHRLLFLRALVLKKSLPRLIKRF